MERRWQVLTVVCIGVFVSSLDLFIVNIAFPDIARDFSGSDLGSLSWVLNAYTIVFAALLIPAGRIADQLGRKRLFIGGLAVFTLASAACALAGSVEALVVARIAQAIGAAFLLPTSLGLLLPEFSAEQRPVAIGIWAASGGVAAAAGPPVGGLLVELSWHWVFLVNLPIGLAAIVAAVRVLQEVRDEDARQVDPVGAAAVLLGIGALVAAIVGGEDWGWTSGRVLGLFAGAAVLLAVVARRSATHPSPIIEPAIVGVRTFRLAVGAGAIFFVGFSAMLLGTVLYLTQVQGEDVLTAGLMIAPGPATAALFSVPGAKLGQRHGSSVVGALGSVLLAAGGAWWLWRLGDDATWATDFLPGMIVGGVGVGLVNPALTAAAAASLPPTRFATGAAILTMGRQFGTALGVAFLVPVLGTGVPDAAAFDGVWALVILGGVGAGVGLGAIGNPASSPSPVPSLTSAEVPA